MLYKSYDIDMFTRGLDIHTLLVLLLVLVHVGILLVKVEWTLHAQLSTGIGH